MGKVIGIDLGTTNSVVAIMEGGAPKVLENQEGQRTTPSIVAFTKDGERLAGVVAKRQAVTNPTNTIYSAKRYIGRNFDEVKDEIALAPYKVVAKGDDLGFEVDGKLYSPEEISASVLGKLKQVAEDYLGHEVTEAVITVPAYFNDSQRQATKDAGRIAGLEVKRIINEPTAAALAYGLDKKKDQKIIIYDLGGGTFDVSVLEVGSEVVEVKATNGDTQLGGDNFDTVILEWLIEGFKKDQGMDLRTETMALQRLKEAAEKTKIELSTAMESEINLPYITADQNGPKHLVTKLTRSKFEQLTEDLVKRTLEPCKQAIKDSGFSVDEVDEVVLVGGSTRIPAVQKAVKEFFGKDPNKSVNPDEVVALGAAVQGGVLAGDVKDVLLLDVTPLSLGIEVKHGVFVRLIDKNTTIPTKKSKMFSTAENNQTSVDVHVLQGEGDLAVRNQTLGRFELTGIPPAPLGQPQIEVTFDMDANGILSVTAQDKGTGKEQVIKITAKSGLSEEDIQRMVQEAEKHADEDKKKLELINAKNQLDSMVFAVEKLIKENGDDLPADDVKKTEEAIAQAKEVTSKEDINLDEIKGASERLENLSHALSGALYEKKKSEGPQEGDADGSASAEGGASNSSKSKDDVIDADFKDVN